jgi:anti-sigma B factor antagonist
MDVRVERTEGGVAVISISGDVDKNNSPEVRDAIVPLFAENPPAVVVDLSEVSYMDSSGIATLTEGLQLAHRAEIPFRLAGVGPPIKDVFELAKLERLFAIFETKEGALKDL